MTWRRFNKQWWEMGQKSAQTCHSKYRGWALNMNFHLVFKISVLKEIRNIQHTQADVWNRFNTHCPHLPWQKMGLLFPRLLRQISQHPLLSQIRFCQVVLKAGWNMKDIFLASFMSNSASDFNPMCIIKMSLPCVPVRSWLRRYVLCRWSPRQKSIPECFGNNVSTKAWFCPDRRHPRR